jgi:hypothetical protein
MRFELRWMLLLVGMVANPGGSLALAQKVKTVETVDQQLALLFKTPALAPLREPDRVEALPVWIIGDGLASTFRVVEKPAALDAQTMRNLRRTLLDTDAYSGGVSACMFTPAVALRFYKGAEPVQVVICFMCGELIFQDAAGRDLSGRLMIGEARTQLLAAARKAFPKNQALQVLPE